MTNYFNILKVSEDAEIEVIHAAYRGLAKKYHPDVTRFPKDVAEKKMAEINEAYSILSDDELREKHLSELHKAGHKAEDGYNRTYTQKENYTAYETTTDDHGIGFYIMISVVIISIICCLVYFIPEIVAETWKNIKESIQEIWSTFQ